MSLIVFHNERVGLHIWQLNNVFQAAASCATLEQLTVIAQERCAWAYRPVPVQLAMPNRLRYLHFRTHRELDFPHLQHAEFDIPLPATITHLALVIDEAQGKSLLHTIDTEHLPHLTHCHVNCRHPTDNRGWQAAIQAVRQELGAERCEKEEDVMLWRADRVWQRSVDLPDDAEE